MRVWDGEGVKPARFLMRSVVTLLLEPPRTRTSGNLADDGGDHSDAGYGHRCGVKNV